MQEVIEQVEIPVLKNYNFQIEDSDYTDNKLKLIVLPTIEVDESEPVQFIKKFTKQLIAKFLK